VSLRADLYNWEKTAIPSPCWELNPIFWSCSQYYSLILTGYTVRKKSSCSLKQHFVLVYRPNLTDTNTIILRL
jgi:hypothetical protein